MYSQPRVFLRQRASFIRKKDDSEITVEVSYKQADCPSISSADNSFHQIPCPERSSRMASSSSGSESAGAQRSSPKLSLIDLPLESQTQIIENVRCDVSFLKVTLILSQVSPKSLFSLQLVSKHFHGLASSRIYRSLEFNLSHPDAPRYYRESHYRLADALQTFATSDHDYAQYVKRFQLRMSDIETEDAQRRIASRYHASEEPTMFLNMALLLMIKKARAMEDFR